MIPTRQSMIRDALDWAWQQEDVKRLDHLPPHETLLRSAQRKKACNVAMTRLGKLLKVDAMTHLEALLKVDNRTLAQLRTYLPQFAVDPPLHPYPLNRLTP